MANLTSINGISLNNLSKLFTPVTLIKSVNNIDLIAIRVTWSSVHTLTFSPGSGNMSGVVTVSGSTASFKAFAAVYTGGGTTTTLTINGAGLSATQPATPGTNVSTGTVVLGIGTYSYSGSVSVSAGSGAGGFQWTQ